MKIILDVDGVLADFCFGFTSLINQGYPEIPVCHTRDNTGGWNFSHIPTEYQRKAWNLITNSKTWWTTLKPLGRLSDFNELDRLNREHEVYFITVRPGKDIKLQTEKWLRKQGVQRPSVIAIAGDTPKAKTPVILALQPDIVVDDFGPLIIALAQLLGYESKTLLILQNQPYNNKGINVGVRTQDLDDTIQMIKETIKKRQSLN